MQDAFQYATLSAVMRKLALQGILRSRQQESGPPGPWDGLRETSRIQRTLHE